MSSNCPPQLQLSTTTTNFKRSFEQLVGFDLDSPVGPGDHHHHHLSNSEGSGHGHNNAGNDRNKRARSSSSTSSSESARGMPLRSGSASSSGSSSSGSSLLPRRRPNERLSSHSSASSSRPVVVLASQQDPPPRLPTPMIQDIEMSDYSPVDDNTPTTHTQIQQQPQQSSEERYRLSLERFNAFESEISILRRSPPASSSSSAHAPVITLPLPLSRPPTPPPTLPPLSIVSLGTSSSTANQNQAHGHVPMAIPFFHPAPRPTTPLETLFSFESPSPSSTMVDSPTTANARENHPALEQELQQQQQEEEGQSYSPNLEEAPESPFQFHDTHFSTSLRNPFILPLSFSTPQIQMDHRQGPSTRQSNSISRRTPDEIRRFRERLDTALERLRPDSPLVPGLQNGEERHPVVEIEDEDEDNDSEEDEEQDEDDEGEDEDEDEDEDDDDDDEDENIPPPSQPPTLPPIPPITANEEGEDWAVGDTAAFLEQRQHRRSESPPRIPLPPPLPANGNSRLLGDHPLPSPILRDLHSWMEERGGNGSSGGGESASSSGSGLNAARAQGSSHQHQHQYPHYPEQQQQQHQRRTSSVSTSNADSDADSWAFYDNLNMFTAALSSSTTITTTTTTTSNNNNNNQGPTSTSASAPVALASPSSPASSTSLSPPPTVAVRFPAQHLISMTGTVAGATAARGSGTVSGPGDASSSSSSLSASSASLASPAGSSNSNLFANLPSPVHNHYNSNNAISVEPNRNGHFVRSPPPSLLWRSQQFQQVQQEQEQEQDENRNPHQSQSSSQVEMDLTFASLMANAPNSPSPIAERNVNATATTTNSEPTPTSTSSPTRASFASFLSLDGLFGLPTPPADSQFNNSYPASTTRPTASATSSQFSEWRFRPTPSASTVAPATAPGPASVNPNPNSTSTSPPMTRISPPEPMSPMWPWDPPVSSSRPSGSASASASALASTSTSAQQQQHQRDDLSPSPTSVFPSSTSSSSTVLRSRSLRSMPSFTRFGSSTSLVSENAAEVRRRADHAEMLVRERDRVRRRTMDLSDSMSGSGSTGNEGSEREGLGWRFGLTDATNTNNSTNANATAGSSSSSTGAGHPSRTHTLGEFINERLRDLHDGSEDPDAQASDPGSSSEFGRFRLLYQPEEEERGTPTQSGSSSGSGPPASTRERDRDRNSALDSSILGRRGRWGLPMLATSSTSATPGPTSAAPQSSASDMAMAREIDIFGTSRHFTTDPPSPLSLSFTSAVHSPTSHTSATAVATGDSGGGGGGTSAQSRSQSHAGGPSSMDSPELEFIGPWSVFGGETNQASTSNANPSNPTSTSTSVWPSSAPRHIPSSSFNNERRDSLSRRSSFSLDVMEGIVDSNTTDENGTGTGMFIPSRVPPTLPPPDLGGNLGGTFDAEQRHGHAQPSSPTAAADASSTSNSFSLQDIDIRYENMFPSQPSRRSSGSTDESDDMEVEFFGEQRPQDSPLSRRLSLQQLPSGPRSFDQSNEMPLNDARSLRERRLADRLEETTRLERERERMRERREAVEAERMRLRAGLRLRARVQAQAQDQEAQNAGGSGWSSSSANQGRDLPLFSEMRRREDSLERLRRTRAQFLAANMRNDNNNNNGSSPTSATPMTTTAEPSPFPGNQAQNTGGNTWSSFTSASQEHDQPLFSGMRTREDSLERLRRTRAQLLAASARGDNNNSSFATSSTPTTTTTDHFPSNRDRRSQNFAHFDPESFTPGPFRNTMMHYRNTINAQSLPTSLPPPPSIPPLSFGNDYFLPRPAGASNHPHQDSISSSFSSGLDTNRDSQASRHETATSASAAGATRPGGPRNPSIQPTRVLPRSFASARAASQLSNSNMNNESSASRGGASGGRADLHNFMTRRVRMEPSRVDESGDGSPVSPQFRTDRDGPLGAGGRQVPGQRSGNLEPLRPDGHNTTARHAQLVEQFRREHGLAQYPSSVRDPEGAEAPHPYPHRHQPPAQSRRPFIPVYARRGSLFGLSFEGVVDFAEEEDSGSNRNGPDSDSVNSASSSASARRRHVEVIDLSEDEATQTDTSAPSITTASRRRFVRMHPPEMMMFARGFRGGRSIGDFMRDEDFDESYEGLLSLSQTLGDVKPRSTPNEMIEKMEKAEYKDWATLDSDKRCPICLDDYGQTDTVLKLPNCSHWLHQDCLHQWLMNANTCPVCRKSAITPSTSSSSTAGSPSTRRARPAHHHHHHHIHPLRPHLAQHMPVPPNVQPRPLPQARPRNSLGVLRMSSLLGPRPSNGGNAAANLNTDHNSAGSGRGQPSTNAGHNRAGQGNANNANPGTTSPGDAPSGNFW